MSQYLTDLALAIDTTAPNVPLHLVVRIDNKEVAYQCVDSTARVEFSILDMPGDHLLEIEMVGKEPAHCVVNEQGEIVQDARLVLKKFDIDTVDCKHVLHNQAEYHHNYNGNADPIQDAFCGELGCNGTVKFSFSTPIYPWLLANR